MRYKYLIASIVAIGIMAISAYPSNKYNSFSYIQNIDKTPKIVNLKQMQARRPLNCDCGIPTRRESGATRMRQSILVNYYS